MMSRRASVAVIFGVTALLGATACKSGDPGGGGAGGGGAASQDAPVILPPSNGQSCAQGGTCDDQAAIEAYSTCIVSTCDAEYKQCFGDAYMSGTFGGDCKELMDCASQCTDCDQTCLTACSNQHFVGACKDCILGPITKCAISAITSGTCTVPCLPGGSSSAVCDKLEACCNSMSGSDQTDCLSTYNQVKIGGDTGCQSVLGTYQSSGKCQ